MGAIGTILLLYGAALAVTVWAWGRMLNAMARPLPWHQHAYIYITTSVTRRLPGSLWHVAGRAMLYHQRAVPGRAVALASALEVAWMMVSGAAVVLLLWPLLARHMQNRWNGLLLIVAIGIAGLVLLHPASWRRLRRLSGEMEPGASGIRWQEGLGWLAAYAVSWLCGGSIVLVLAHSLHPLPLQAWAGVVASWVLAYLLGLMIAILPSGLGVAELSLTVALTAYMPPGIAALVAIASRLVFTMLEVGAALLMGAAYTLSERLTHR